MVRFLYFALLLFVLGCATDNPNAQFIASTPKVTGRVIEVALFEYDSTDIIIHKSDILNYYFVLETFNQTPEPITLCNPKLLKEGQHPYPDDFFLKSCRMDIEDACIDYIVGNTIIIPPFRKRLDTVLVGGYVTPAPGMADYYADIKWQMERIERYKKGDLLWIYSPRPAPYYQDTIFYPFAKEVKYSKHWHGLDYWPAGWQRSI